VDKPLKTVMHGSIMPAYGYHPNHRTLLSYILYQIILLGDRDDVCEHLAQSHYLAVKWSVI